MISWFEINVWMEMLLYVISYIYTGRVFFRKAKEWILYYYNFEYNKILRLQTS